jgi:hypothetical protein
MYHFQVQKMTRMQLWMICLYRSYENCRRPGVAILDMQMSKVPIISGYVFSPRTEELSTVTVYVGFRKNNNF